MRFIDSNIWLYAVISTGDQKVRAKAKAVVKAGPRVISTQVVNEVCSNLIRKAAFDDERIEKVIRSLYRRCIVVPVDQDSLLKACGLRRRYAFSFWDSNLVACALLHGCTDFETEDMQDGLLVDGRLTIRNPLLH